MGPPAVLKREPKFVIAGRFWRWFLNKHGFAAIWMPWRRIYVLEQRFHDTVLREHERVHSEQAEREGVIAFCIKYLWKTFRHGYWDNPYEIEARTRYGYNWKRY